MTPTRSPRSPRARWALSAAALSLVVGLTQCSSPPPPRFATPTPATQVPEVKQTFSLTNADIDALKKQAGSGSGAAAYRLALYYETVRHDDTEAKRWMKASAESGDMGGMYGYASYLKGSSDPDDRATARTWLEKVAAQGDDVSKSVARRDLRELDAAAKADK
jgi:hypothetical protein